MSVIYGGYIPQPGRWTSGVKRGGVNTPPVEFIIDETLPVLGQDLNIPNRDWIVIPRGRLVAVKATTLTRRAEESILTIANGVNPLNQPSGLTGNFPFGYAPFNMYRNFSGLPADRPLGVLHETIELPYTTINDAYCNTDNGGTHLVNGEWVMPYFGANNTTSAVPQDRGKCVRWFPRKVWTTVSSSASAIVQLAKAPYPAFQPNVIMAFDAAGAAVVTGTVSVAYNTDFDKWVVTYGQSVKTVMYEWGAHESQRVGQVISIEPVSTAGGLNATSHEMAGWLKWVTDNFGAWDWPPIMDVRPTSSTTEVVTITDGAGVLSNTPIVPFKTITVTVTGTLTAADGTVTTLTGTVMSLADDLFFNDFTQGQYYDIDFLTGAITFASNVSVTACTVAYSYESSFADGRKWDRGILGLTDGRDSGIVGLPPHLDVAGVIGVMRVLILP